jgi:hypothetical protein
MAGGQRLISWLHPCSTSNVALNTRTSAHGPLMAIQIGPGVTFTPLKEPDVLVGPTHPSNADPYAMPCAPSQAHTHSICPHIDPSKCPGTFPLNARLYVQCRPICHVVCPIPGPHAPCALCPHTDPYVILVFPKKTKCKPICMP